MIEINNVFPTNIWSDSYQLDTSKELEFVNKLAYSPNDLPISKISESTDVLSEESLKHINDYIKNSVFQYLNEVFGLSGVSTEFNVNISTSRIVLLEQNTHIPRNIIDSVGELTGVFYFRSSHRASALRLHNTNDFSLYTCIKDYYTDYNKNYIEVFCETNELVMFPSYLDYSIDLNIEQEPVVALIFNVNVDSIRAKSWFLERAEYTVLSGHNNNMQLIGE